MNMNKGFGVAGAVVGVVVAAMSMKKPCAVRLALGAAGGGVLGVVGGGMLSKSPTGTGGSLRRAGTGRAQGASAYSPGQLGAGAHQGTNIGAFGTTTWG